MISRYRTFLLLFLACAFTCMPARAQSQQADAAHADSLPLKIMTFNIRYGTADDGPNSWPFRRGQLFKLIARRGCDVVGLQETLYGQLTEITRVIPHCAYAGVGRDDGKAQGEFAAILYRTDRCDLVDQGTFWFSDTPGIAGSKHWGNDVTRICTWARLRMRANGRCIYVFNVHLDHVSQVSRERSTRLLKERIARREHPGDPAIVTGDFNTGATNEALRTLLSPASDGTPAPFIDTWRTMHPSDDEIGTYHAFKGGSSGEKIDFILVEPGTRVRAADVLQDAEGGRYPSDHYPVTAGCTMYWNR